VSWITARRRHPAAGYVVVAFVLALIGTAYAVITSGHASASSPVAANSAQIAEGRSLFVEDCATCHGLFAQGQAGTAPSLIGVGAAAVDFQVSTGRMPAAAQDAENDRKPPHLDTKQTHAVAAYIQSLGGGPTIPSAAQVSKSGADVGLGQQLFVADCAACHNFVGAGGALTYGKFAPPLTKSTPTQMYEAMLTGPEAMPVFNDLTITPQEKRDIIAYVSQVRSQPNPGGFSLGRVGPLTEGLVAFLGLLLSLVLAALWITAKHGKAHE
jgi:ubiquinol-cytochrome c reductase cytochrome c subunit